MKTLLGSLAAIAALSLMVVAPTARAVSLTTASTSYVGLITPDVPSDPADASSYIDFLTSLSLGTTDTFSGQTITRSNNSFGSLPAANFSYKSDNNNTDFSLTNFTGYVLAKYDASNAGAWVWYLDSFTGDISVPALFGDKYGLSHTDFYGGTPSVPDSGTTAIILGLGLLSVAAAGRRFGFKA